MNRTLKRVLGLAGSVVVGFGGAIAFASAAGAHHPTTTPDTICLEDGSWQITWEVTDWNWKDYPQFDVTEAGWLTEVESSDAAPLEGDIEEGAALPYPGEEEPLTATQTVSADVEEVTLYLKAEWSNGAEGNNDREPRTAYKPASGCVPEAPDEPEPTVKTASDCFGVTVTVANENEDKLFEYTLTPSTGDPVTVTPEYGEEIVEYFPVEDPEAGLSVAIAIDGQDALTYDWDVSETNCEWGVIWETCDGLEFELAIPEDAPETTFTFTPSEGDERVVTLAPGESVTEAFDASGDELTVSYVIDDGKDAYEGEVSWTKPEDCEEAPAEETTPAADEQLPATGSNLTIMISAAAALVAAAAVLFFIARRRRAAAADW